MSTATPAPAPETVVQIHISSIVASPLNPRQYFDEDKLRQLAESIKQDGIVTPIIVRPITTRDLKMSGTEFAAFELIDGERRFRASQAIGLDTMPAIVRDMSDEDAAKIIRIALITSIQKEGLTELEEAQGFHNVMELTNKNREAVDKKDVKAIAAEIGKSKEYVYARLKLLDASDATKKALAAGKITAGHAVILARRSPSMQKQLIPNIVDHGITVNGLARYIASQFVDLRLAPFDKVDPQLVKKAGACIHCPKYAAVNLDVLEETKTPEQPKGDPNMCSDAGCFNGKRIAHFEALAAKIKKEHGLKKDLLLVSLGQDDDFPGALPFSRWTEVSGKNPCVKAAPALIVSTPNWNDESSQRRGKMVAACVDRKCPKHGDHEYRELPKPADIKAKEQAARTSQAAATVANEDKIRRLLVRIPKKDAWKIAAAAFPVGAAIYDELSQVHGLHDPATRRKWLEKSTSEDIALFFLEMLIRTSPLSVLPLLEDRDGRQANGELHTSAKPAPKVPTPAKVKTKPAVKPKSKHPTPGMKSTRGKAVPLSAKKGGKK